MHTLRLVVDNPSPQPNWLERLGHYLNRLEPYRSEALFALSSLWASWVLVAPPSNFGTFPGGFRFAAELATERQWALFAFVAGVAKVVGLGLTACRRCRDTSLMLRLVGLAMSGLLWVLLGVSAVVGNPDTLFGFPVLLFGATAWWLLLRFPIMPAK